MQQATLEPKDHAEPKRPAEVSQEVRPGQAPTRRLLRALGNQAMSRLLQAKLTVSEPGDIYEQEADRVADQVMRMSDPAMAGEASATAGDKPHLQRKCACGGSGGECESCKEQKKEEEPLRRKAVSPGTPHGAPPIVHEVLRSAGRPLDSATRAFFEPRFGCDFGNVRVHTDARAAESARAVKALAYTVRSNIVFGAGAFDQESTAGKKLLAHELTHVLQQSDGSHDEPSKTESSDHLPGHRLTHQPPALSRQEAEVEPEIEVEEDVEERVGEPTRERGQRYARPRSNSLEAILEQMSMEAQRKRAIGEAEVPFATLERGGKPPDFVTFERIQPILTQIGRGGEVLETKQYAFHILDAIEYAVGFANNNGDLIRILRRFIPVADVLSDPFRALDLPVLPLFRIVPNLDPDGTIRLRAFDAAVMKRKKQSPRLAREPALDPLEAQETAEPGKKRRGRCTIERRRGFLGNDPLATLFCQYATKSLFEYRITSPLYGYVDADAVLGDTMNECKCGYASLLRGLSKDKWWAKLQEDKLTEQVLRHQRIVQDCGLRYRYLVSNPEFAEFLRVVWPSIDIEHVPWEPCD